MILQVGVKAFLRNKEGRKENPCRREGGSWHYWKLYKENAIGEVVRSKDETKQDGTLRNK